MVRIGVIGGGAAGLAAAYELALQGHYAEVFEQAPFLGGQASTFPVGAGRLERGYHHLFLSDKSMIELIDELGLGCRLKWFESRVGLYHGGKVWDFSTPQDLLRFRPLPARQRVRVGLRTALLQRTRNWRKFEQVTAQDWILAHMGPEAYQVIWEPLLRGKFGEYFDQVSMAWLWGKFRLRVSSRGKPWQLERLGYPLESFGEVFDRLALRIEELGGKVRTGEGIARIVTRDGRATGLLPNSAGENGPTVDFDAVISTTPSYIFPRLVDGLTPEYLEKLSAAKYLSAVLVILELTQPLSGYYWMNIADRSLPFVGLIEHTNLIDKRLYDGNPIVYVTNYLSREDPLYRMEPDELLAEYAPHLKKINPDFNDDWIVRYHYHKVDAAQPIIGVGYGERIPEHRTPVKNLYLANTTQIYPEDRGTNYSVQMGRQVARMVMGDLG